METSDGAHIGGGSMEDKETTSILSSGIETLYTMKENLLELTGYREKSSKLAAEEDDLERQLAAKEKAQNNETA